MHSSFDRVSAHPETTKIELGQTSRLFLLNGRGAKLAREKGHDPIPAVMSLIAQVGPLFAGKANLQDMSGLKITGQILEDAAVVVWWGLLAAQPDTTLEEVEDYITPGFVQEFLTTVVPKIFNYTRDASGEKTNGATAEVGAEGN